MNASPHAKSDGSISASIGSAGLTDGLQIEYSPRPDTSLKGEAETLAAVYSFLIDCFENQKATEPNSGDDDVEGGDGEGE